MSSEPRSSADTQTTSSRQRLVSPLFSPLSSLLAMTGEVVEDGKGGRPSLCPSATESTDTFLDGVIGSVHEWTNSAGRKGLTSGGITGNGKSFDGHSTSSSDLTLRDEDVNWKQRCEELESSLQRFRNQAAKIREVLRDKLADLERRVVEAERRAEAAEQRAQLMEDRLVESSVQSSADVIVSSSPSPSSLIVEPHQLISSLITSGGTLVSPSTSTTSPQSIQPNKDVIDVLESEVEQQKKLRIQDAKQVEAKAAKIKEWVTNKLKELEQQNQHLREQNQKCNEQLELLRNRLVQLSQLHPASRNKLSKDRDSAEDSSRGSFEERCCESDDGYPSEPGQDPRNCDCSSPSNPIRCQLANELNNCQHRNNQRNHQHIRNASFDASFDQLYAAVDYSKKRSQLRSAPPRVKIERKKYDNHVSIVSSVASDEFCDLDVNNAYEPLLDAALVDPLLENGSPLPSRAAKKGVMHHSKVTDSAPCSPSAGHSSRSASPATRGVRNHKLSPVDSKTNDGYGSLDRNLTGQRKLTLTEIRGGSERDKPVRSDNETHDYAEIYTPGHHEMGRDLYHHQHHHNHRHPHYHHHRRSVCGIDDNEEKPPTPPLHRFPSWESRIYDVAVNGITVPESLQIAPTGSPNNNSKPNQDSYSNGAFPDLNIPVYATVKGRASQIRSVPFTGESSDSSDNEDTRVTTTNSSHTTSGETESSLSTGGSPSKGGGGAGKNSSSALHPPTTPVRQGSTSPTKSVKRDTSVESVLSDDYAIPPDAISSDAISIDSVEPHGIRSTPNIVELSPKKESLEKSGYLTKLGGKLKTWRRRWFVLKNGTLSYFKSQNDVFRKPQGLITLDDVCRVTRAEGAATFEISTGKRSYYLTAESVNTMEEWIKVLQNVLRRNATRLLLSKEDNRPTMEGWLTKVKHGHSRRCWCVLIGRMFLYFKTPNETTPLGQINMRDARVEEVSHVSDSDEDDHDDTMSKSEHTVGIFPNHQGPTYLLMATKQELDSWLYHLTVVSSGDNFVGTQFEQLVTKLMEVDGDENSVLWRHPLLLYSKENIPQPLTTLPSDTLQVEATKLFKSIQLFISVPLETSGIDYHIALAQNSLQQCLLYPELQNELFCQLIKQTSRHSHHRLGVQQLLLCATQSLFLCDTSSVEKTSNNSSTSPGDRPTPTDSKLNPAPFVFIQGWQLLALTVTLFVPKNRTLWFLRVHLQRNAESKTEAGKYATFCQRALERTLQNGARECKPSRMEVLSILLKNPYHHSLPHSIPVHYLNGTYQVVGFDGSSTVEEFIQTLNAEAGIRDSSQSGFALYSDDPIDKSMEHCLQNSAKLCDVISKWEQALREKHLGKFENTKVLKLTYKNRLCFRQLLKAETDRERILTVYQINEDIVQGRFPLSLELSLELAALMAQIEFGDYNADKPRGSTGTPVNPQHQLQQVLERFFPQRYRDPPNEKKAQERIKEKWIALKGRNVLDCVRIYLNCARKWSFCGSRLYSAKLRGGEQQPIWLAVTEDSVALLDCVSMQPLVRYPYSMVVTFGGCRDDFMLVISQPTDMAVSCGGISDRAGDSSTIGRSEAHSATATTEKLLFSMPKPKILELTLLIADYMNALGRPTTVPPSPQASTLSRLEKIRAKIRATTASGSGSPTAGSLRASSLVLTTAVGSVSCASTLCSGSTMASTFPGTSHSDTSKLVSTGDLNDGARSQTRNEPKKRGGRDST